MQRTQVQFEETTWEKLRERAFREKRSISAVLREIVRKEFSETADQKKLDRAVFSFVGSGRSRGKGSGTIARRHTEEAAEALRK